MFPKESGLIFVILSRNCLERSKPTISLLVSTESDSQMNFSVLEKFFRETAGNSGSLHYKEETIHIFNSVRLLMLLLEEVEFFKMILHLRVFASRLSPHASLDASALLFISSREICSGC